MLQVGRAQGGVRVGGIGEQGAHIAHRVRPLIETSNDGQANGNGRAVRIANEVEGVRHRVDAIAEEVAEGGRSEHRNEQIGSRPGAIVTERVAKRTQMMRQAGGAGDIDHAAEPHRRIDHEPDRRLAGPTRA
ncbi:MAG: hypothetical protein ABSD80_03890 [Caulobacteraceae bacterium]|jgi:hypothetical protein